MQGLSNATSPWLVRAYTHFDFVEITLEIPSVPHEAREELLNSCMVSCHGLACLGCKVSVFISSPHPKMERLQHETDYHIHHPMLQGHFQAMEETHLKEVPVRSWESEWSLAVVGGADFTFKFA